MFPAFPTLRSPAAPLRPAWLLLACALLSPLGTASARGWLGVSVQDLTPDLREAIGLTAGAGALVSDVVPGGPAEKAGLCVRDLIVRVEDDGVEDAEDLIDAIRTRESGDRVRLTILREEEEVTLTAKLGKLPEEGLDRLRRRPPADIPDRRPPKHPGPRIGIEAYPIDEHLAPYFRTDPGRGILVLKVIDDSPAERAGLRSGDVILGFNGREISRVEELRRALRGLRPGDEWRIEGLREGQRRSFRGTIEGGWVSSKSTKRPLRLLPRSRSSDLPDRVQREMRTLRRELENLRERLRDLEKRIDGERTE